MERWDALEAKCRDCQACPLSQRRTNMVFGVGRKDADIMLIGEGPGMQEDLQGEPFVGPAGKLLDDMLSIIDLNRSNVYIANIVKCRPPNNRDPMEEEQDACIGYLKEQIQLVQPKIIVALGRIAGARIQHPGIRITREHGMWACRNGIWHTTIYHPSALLRKPELRPETFDDLLSIREKIREVGARI
ncbi:MAG: uracil-DNA glycosylase [Oscillospiraceae bacterium]|nr:uracil-DNA glycosylase [Oscillospiraceae bacterium]